MSAGQYVLAGAAGLVGGFVNSIAGGGSLLLFPALVAGGMGTVAANVTNSVALCPGYLGNVVALGGAERPGRSALRPITAAILGSVLGCVVLLVTPSGAFDLIVPFLVLGATALVALQPRIKRALPAGGTARPAALIIGSFVGGIYGGYFGGGLGVIMMALLGLTVTAPLGVINSMKGLLQLAVATVSLIAFGLFGPVHWTVAALIAPLALLGGVLGGRLARRLSEPVLRSCVVVFGLAVGVWLLIRAL